MKTNESTMSGMTFFILLSVLVAGLFAAGYILSPESAPTMNTLLVYLGRLAVRFTIAAAFGLLYFAFFWTTVLELEVTDISNKMKQNGNDSYSIIIVTFLFALPATILLFAGGNTVSEFASAALTKGSVGIAIGSLLSVTIARLFKVNSLGDFAGWIFEPDNNNYVILITSAFVASVAVAVAAA